MTDALLRALPRATTLATGALLLWTSAAAAQTEARRLTLAEARDVALSGNPAMHIGSEAVIAAQARRRQARAARLPQIALSAQYARLSNVPPSDVTLPSPPFPSPVVVQIAPTILNNYRADATAAQPLFTGFRLANSERAAAYLATAATADLQATGADLVYSVDNAYWSLYDARAAQGVITESVRLTEAYLADVRRMREVGLMTEEDVLGVEVRLSEARLRLVQVDQAAEVAEAALANLLSLPPESHIALADTPRVLTQEAPSLDELRRLALDRRPELHATVQRTQAAERQVAVEHGGRLPTIALVADYQVSRPNQRFFPSVDEWKSAWSLAMGMTWTAWDWGIVSGREAQAEAQARQADEGERQLRQAIALQVVQSRAVLVDASRRIDLANETIRQAEEHYRGLRERSVVGMATSTDVMDAEVSLEGARLSLVQALTDQQVAWSGLERATGGTLP